jgi:hypothetical protein
VLTLRPHLSHPFSCRLGINFLFAGTVVVSAVALLLAFTESSLRFDLDSKAAGSHSHEAEALEGLLN